MTSFAIDVLFVQNLTSMAACATSCSYCCLCSPTCPYLQCFIGKAACNTQAMPQVVVLLAASRVWTASTMLKPLARNHHAPCVLACHRMA
jgi:hypothetical protein